MCVLGRPPPPPTEGQNEQWREANRRRQRQTLRYRGLVRTPPPHRARSVSCAPDVCRAHPLRWSALIVFVLWSMARAAPCAMRPLRPLPWALAVRLCLWGMCFWLCDGEEPLRAVALVGTRPEAIKMAPVIWELQRHPDAVECHVVDTGQHVEMLRPLLRFFGIVPNVSLSIMTRSQSLASLTAQLAAAMDRALQEIQPHVILVQGDTTSAFVAGLTAFYHRIPIGHVEVPPLPPHALPPHT